MNAVSHIQAASSEFWHLIPWNAALTRLATGCLWAEGPVWVDSQHILVWSDIPANRMLQYDVTTDITSVFRSPSNFANGNTLDHADRLITCEHRGRRVTRTESDGTVTVLADSYHDCRLNSPNDVVVAHDGAVWFTDPTYGILSDYEGGKADPELPTSLYRFDPTSGSLIAQTTALEMPNGLCFSPDGTRLYVVDSGVRPGVIHTFEVGQQKILHSEHFLDLPEATSDGIRCDQLGNVWAAVQGDDGYSGVHVFDPTGSELGRILIPEKVSNLCFGGFARQQLFVTASTSLYTIDVLVS